MSNSDQDSNQTKIKSLGSAPISKYQRFSKTVPIRSVQDKKLKGTLRKAERKAKEDASRAAQSELLLTQESGYLEAEGMEKTWKFQQSVLKDHVDLNTCKKMFTLKLTDFGPYSLDYTRNGRHMLIGGRKGHVAAFDWKSGKLSHEIHLHETVKDVKWLHNETMFAVAQKKYTYIYDNDGVELHCLKDHIEVNKLEFLPYHFLLATVGNAGFLKYQDTSTGKLVAEHRTKLGRCDAMAQNPYNAIIHLGHANGTVTLWSPSMSQPLVKMLCHRGPVQSLACDQSGYYMTTAGLDGQMKIWDIRTFKLVDHYYTPTPASHVSISQQGLLAVGYGPNVSVWKDIFREKQKEPYMKHLQPGSKTSSLKFCPFEDVLGLGHTNGISSLIIPGSGEPNYDTMEANPYQTKKQRQESEVHHLLEKIQPEMISLNPNFVGQVDRAPAEVIKEEQRIEWEANHPTEKFVPSKKAKGKSSAMRRYLRKQTNVVDAKRLEKLKERDQQKRKREMKEEAPRTALDRFKKQSFMD